MPLFFFTGQFLTHYSSLAMTSGTLSVLSARFAKPRPEIRPGYTVRVHERIQESDKERVQIFEGLVIAVKNGSCPTDASFTVRKIASGVGVERVFSLLSPNITTIDVKKVAAVRRAKLFFLRGRRGKSARLSERFTTSGEFALAVAPEAPEEAIASEVVVSGIPKEDVTQETPEAEKE